ncbi:MAG: putative metallopeptidase [Bacteroidota bacterium]
MANITSNKNSKWGYSMADIPYKADRQIVSMMQDLIRDHHPDLLPIMDGIALLFKEKPSKSGGKTVYGKTSKASPILESITGTKWYFVITLSQDGWTDLNIQQRLALLDHHLCACRVDFDDVSGEYKHSIGSPDVVGYYDEIERHGLWRPREDEEDETPDSAEAVEQAFSELKGNSDG